MENYDNIITNNMGNTNGAERRDKKMCKKLNDLRGKTPEEVLNLAKIDSDKLPVDIEMVLKNLGISFGAKDFSDWENGTLSAQVKEKGNILGAVAVVGDSIGILYKKDDSPNRIRFTIAHELAHCCLHTDALINGHIQFRNQDSFNENQEKDANIFAGKLLIPNNKLNELYDAVYPIPVSNELAKEFGVSIPVMEARLKHESKLYYSRVAPKQNDREE